MALYTVEAVIAKVKILIEEAEDTNIITQSQLISAVSDAQKWVAAETGCYKDWSTITLLKNTIRYDAPTATSGIIGMQYDYGNDLGVRDITPARPDDVPHSSDNNAPYFWHFQGNEISVYPKLNPLPSNVTVDVLYGKIPVALTALNASLVIPDEFQIVVPYHVAKVVAIKDNQSDKVMMLNTEIQRLTAQSIAQYDTARGGAVGRGGSQGAET